MIYLIDFFYVVFFIAIKECIVKLLYTQPDIFSKIWQNYLWFEFSYVLVGIYFLPHHTPTQGMVAFSMSFSTRLCFIILRPVFFKESDAKNIIKKLKKE